MKFRPLHGHVLVQRFEAAKISKGGIIIPDPSKEKPLEGRVLAVGNGKELPNGSFRPLDVKVGDHVLVAQHGWQEFKDPEGRECMIVEEDMILCIFE